MYNDQFYNLYAPTYVVISVLKQAQSLTTVNCIKNTVYIYIYIILWAKKINLESRIIIQKL